MDNFVAHIAQQAAAIKDNNHFSGCLLSERIPDFFSHKTDSTTTERLQKHLETCEECNTLLLALAASHTEPSPLVWIPQGALYVLSQVLSLLPVAAQPAPAMRGPQEEYVLTEQQIELPNGQTVCIRTVAQSCQQILTTFLSDGTAARYELYAESGQVLKSIDNARQFKFELPQDAVTLVIADKYMIHFGGDTHA